MLVVWVSTAFLASLLSATRVSRVPAREVFWVLSEGVRFGHNAQR